ncbi:MAG TPA: glycoside hydrolase family 15 protein [Candidatus Thermoplasmatota archaeon]|jgi:oligosaccharide amylase|nr:glycoside hydrolase family 15 protein [Candidatus Thermoplasmatota archaeon]
MITLLTGNGRLLLTLNGDGEWTQLFHPYAGQFQHLREQRLGIFDAATEKFYWLRKANGFEVHQGYPEGGHTCLTRWEGHGLEVGARDHVHPNHDLVVRTFTAKAPTERALRLFAYHSLTILQSMYQDTAYYDEANDSVIHYKRGSYFEFFSHPAFADCACGEHTLKGLQGSWVDAEDGKLEGRTISHGAADSILQWDLRAGPGGSEPVRLFLAVGRDARETGRLRGFAKTGDPQRFEREAHRYWQGWIQRRGLHVPHDLGEGARDLYHRSVFVMRACTSENGAIIASPDTRSLSWGGDTYNYCWWRDGAYIAKAMDESGLYELSQRFLKFAQDTQHEEGYWAHRHFPDGTFGSTWHPPPFIQVDQTASVVSAAWHHFKRRGDVDLLLDLWPMIKDAANFLARFRDPDTGLPAKSWDLWEERFSTHTYSTAAVVHALERAARIAEELGKDPRKWRETSAEMRALAVKHLWDPQQHQFVRSLGPRDDKADASVLLALKLGLVPWTDPKARATVERIEQALWCKGVGGLARYEGDQYFGAENPWIISTLWLAEAKLQLGDAARARELIQWCVKHASPTGLLPEQVDARTGQATSVTPLAWSHSTFVDVVNKYRRAVEGQAEEGAD